MPTQTLGEITQEILSDMDGDEVNDISDTEESMQVARIVRGSYYEMVDLYDLPGKQHLFKLEATSSSTPTHMTLPDRTTNLNQVEYDKRDDVLTEPTKYAIIDRVDPEVFLERSRMLDADDSDVDTVTDPSGVDLNIKNDEHPTYWTSFDNETIVFNSYKSTVDSNLQKSKTRCWGTKDVEVTLDHNATIELESSLFRELVNRARSACFIRLKQTRDPSSEAMARRLETRLQRTKWRQNGKKDYPDFGR